MGIPDVLVEDGSGGELDDFGILCLGTDAIAFPMRDLGLLFALTSPRLSLVSSLLVLSDECELVSARTMKPPVMPHRVDATQQERRFG